MEPEVLVVAFGIIGTLGYAGHWIDGYLELEKSELKKMAWNVKMANRRGRSEHPRTIKGAYNRYVADDTQPPDWEGFERAVGAILSDDIPTWNGHEEDCAYMHYPMGIDMMISIVIDEDVYVGDYLKKKGELGTMCRNCGGIIG